MVQNVQDDNKWSTNYHNIILRVHILKRVWIKTMRPATVHDAIRNMLDSLPVNVSSDTAEIVRNYWKNAKDQINDETDDISFTSDCTFDCQMHI